MKQALYTRLTALKLLSLVLDQGQTAKDVFTKQLDSREGINTADQNFVRTLVLTTLRRLGQIQIILSSFLSKPLSHKQKEVERILFLGTAQLLFLDIPAHAVVDTCVELTKQGKLSAFSKLVNAVLRNMERQKRTINIPHPIANLPIWLRINWEKTYGLEKVMLFAEKFVLPAPLDVSVRSNPSVWAQKLGGRHLNFSTVRLDQGATISTLSGYDQGDWWVQEASAALPVFLFSDLHGKRVADFCSAPGGKTIQMAVRGAFVDAFDISEYRLRRLKQNIERLHLESQVRVAVQNLEEASPQEIYDAVLLDAPCSATGTIRRQPDLLYHRTSKDVERLSELQKKLLKKAMGFVKVGGELIYATCSLQYEENEAVILSVLQEEQGFERVAVSDPHLKPFTTPAGALLVTPDQDQDGFYACLLRKVKSC